MRWKRGQAITASALNSGTVRGLQNGNMPSQGADRVVLGGGVAEHQKNKPEQSGSAAQPVPISSDWIRWAQIVSIDEDYLVCNFYNIADGTTGGSINVAKPYLLQQTPFDGATITYLNGNQVTYTKDPSAPSYKREHNLIGVDSADYEITPNYYIGELVRVIYGPTNVSVSGSRVYWEEMGYGRYWAEV